MERLEYPNYRTAIVFGIFFCLLIFNVLTVTQLPVREIAFTTIAWTQYATFFLLGFYMHKRRGFDSRMALFAFGMALFVCSYLVSYLFGEEVLASSEALTGVLLMFVFVTGMAQVRWKASHVEVLALISTGLIFIFFLQWMHQGFPTFLYQSSTRNPNIFGALVAALLYFPLAVFASTSIGRRLLLGIGILTGLFLIYMSSARSALLLVFIAIVAKVISLLSRTIFNGLFYMVMVFNLTFVLIYGWLYKSKLLVSFNDWFLEHFGKQIFSGRQEIWGDAVSYGLQAPVFGHFAGILPEDYIPGTHYVHAHNQFLQVFLESGFVGLAGFIFLLYVIWRTYQKNLHSTLTVWSACFYLGILCYQSFEISLYGNMEAIGLFQWLIIAIGLGACITADKPRNVLE